MFLRSADESRVFHDADGRIVQPRHGVVHPFWAGLFFHAHSRPDAPTHSISSKTHHHRLALLIPAALALVLVVGLSSYAFYYKSKVVPGVTVANLSLSGKSKTEAATLLQAHSAELKASISGGPKAAQPTYSELGVSFDISSTADTAIQQGRKIIALPSLDSRGIVYSVKIDEQKLQAYLATITKVNEAPTDASIEIKNGAVTIGPEKSGKSYGIDPAEAKRILLESAKKGLPAKLTVSNYSAAPAITSAMLQPTKSQAEAMIHTSITVTINDKKISPNPAQIGSWLAVTKTKTGASIAADSVRIGPYLDSIAKPFVKPPRAKVVIKNDDGTERVLAAGASGVDIVAKDASAKEIAQAINGKSSYDKSLKIAFAEPKTITAGDYPKWIDVDLTNKRTYAYEHGNMVKEFLVSAGAPSTPTVKGQFAIKTKVRSQDMRGYNADGSRYFQPNVEYVSYFYQDYAIHGNYWRPVSVFGKTNLSHGCVGMINSDAKWVYDWAPVGTVIIVHD